MNATLQGILPILQTPFDETDSIDRDCLAQEIDWAFQNHASGVCSAMVSEILRLTSDERLELNRLIVEFAADRGVVVASIGSESIKQAVQFGRAAMDAGCDAVMAIPPVATALPEDALWAYFTALADAIALPLIVQDASSYVGGGMSISFYVRLLDRYGPEKILFKPEGAPIGPNLSALRDASGQTARIFDGSGGILLVDAWRRGIVGTMPGVELLNGIAALWHALQAEDEEHIYRLYFPICAIVALQMQAGLDGFLAIEKYILVQRGLFQSERRRQPHAWSLDSETRDEIDRLLGMLDDAVDSFIDNGRTR